MIYVYLSSHHYEALDVFKHIVADVTTQLEWQDKTLRTNHGCEYVSDVLKTPVRKRIYVGSLLFLMLLNKMCYGMQESHVSWYGQVNYDTH